MIIALIILIIAWVVCAIILFFSEFFLHVLGRRFLTAIERLMGMILTTMAVQIFLGGIQDFMGHINI